MGEHFDLLIRGGSLVDGTGAPATRGDLGVRDGRIAALGEVSGDADRIIDADGAVVAPGFVDIHTHYDAQILWDRMLSISPWHGVTSVVIGNCGFGVAPTRAHQRDLILQTLESVEGMSLAALQAGLGEEWPFETFPEYLDAIETRGSAINVGVLLGHTPLRLYVMGEEATERDASAEEIESMRRIVAEGLAAGALGFATSKAPTHVGFAGRPVPSRAASLEEIQVLASALGESRHGLLQATIGRGLFLTEFAEIARNTGRTITWTALLAGLFPPEQQRSVLEQSAKLQEQGLDIVPQVSCRPLVVEFQLKAPFPLESLSIFKPVSAADFEGKKQIYADPDFRAAFRERGDQGVLSGRFRDMVISDCPGRPELAERNLSELAAERGSDASDLLLDLSLETDLALRVRMAVANTDETAVAELLGHPATMLGLSDAGAHADQLCDACAPTHLLGHWVRERGVLGLEQPVRLLTARSAEVFGIRDRGRLAPGLAADVTIFDPDTIGCSPLRRVRDLPGDAERLVAVAQGIRAVIVNGRVLREEGADRIDPEGRLPGRLLRGGRP